jgi:hypothetical protein
VSGYCADCGSPRVADLDAPAGLWVCDECGLIQPLSVADILRPPAALRRRALGQPPRLAARNGQALLALPVIFGWARARSLE